MSQSRATLLATATCAVVFVAACGRAPDDNASRAQPAASAAPAAAPASSNARADVEWRYYAGNLAAQRYSALDQINRDNVGKLADRVALSDGQLWTEA